jgi:hypothetical protein
VHVSERRPTRYRVPVTATLSFVVPMLIFGLVTQFWAFVAGAVMATLLSLKRDSLELNDREAIVRSRKPVRLPWDSVAEVRRGNWLGGIVFITTWYQEIRSAAPCSWWGGPAHPDQVAEIEGWWIDHRGPSWTPPPPFVHPPIRRTPPVRYRASTIAGPMAVAGLLAAAANGAALWWPQGGFTVLAVEVTEPSLDHLGWMVAAAIATGLALGAGWALKAHRMLTRNAPRPTAADARPGAAARPVLVMAAIAMTTAVAQWLGVEPAMGALFVMAAGVAAAVAGAWLTVAARNFERQTGRLLLSTNPLGPGLGLESGPPV